jgi:hypothetical protein
MTADMMKARRLRGMAFPLVDRHEWSFPLKASGISVVTASVWGLGVSAMLRSASIAL